MFQKNFWILPNLRAVTNSHFFVSMEGSFKIFLPDIQVQAKEKMFQVNTAAKQSLLQ
jgi:hypothetical protein